jgi:tRNA(adenine34) deaminase
MEHAVKEKLIRLAMLEGLSAVDEGNYPFGAVITDLDGNVIAAAHNTQETDRDPTAHAEINLIRLLSKTHQPEEFHQFYLVSNAESCSMCFSAAIKAGFVHYIFGAPSETHMEPFLTVSDVAKHCQLELDITYGVLRQECIRQIAEIRAYQDHLAQ